MPRPKIRTVNPAGTGGGVTVIDPTGQDVDILQPDSLDVADSLSATIGPIDVPDSTDAGDEFSDVSLDTTDSVDTDETVDASISADQPDSLDVTDDPSMDIDVPDSLDADDSIAATDLSADDSLDTDDYAFDITTDVDDSTATDDSDINIEIIDLVESAGTDDSDISISVSPPDSTDTSDTIDNIDISADQTDSTSSTDTSSGTIDMEPSEDFWTDANDTGTTHGTETTLTISDDSSALGDNTQDGYMVWPFSLWANEQATGSGTITINAEVGGLTSTNMNWELYRDTGIDENDTWSSIGDYSGGTLLDSGAISVATTPTDYTITVAQADINACITNSQDLILKLMGTGGLLGPTFTVLTRENSDPDTPRLTFDFDIV